MRYNINKQKCHDSYDANVYINFSNFFNLFYDVMLPEFGKIWHTFGNSYRKNTIAKHLINTYTFI